MVARQQEHLARKGPQRFEGLLEGFAIEGVVLEDVARDDGEVRLGVARDLGDALHRVVAGQAHRGAVIPRHVMRAQPDLPVRRVNEAGPTVHVFRPPPRPTRRLAQRLERRNGSLESDTGQT